MQKIEIYGLDKNKEFQIEIKEHYYPITDDECAMQAKSLVDALFQSIPTKTWELIYQKMTKLNEALNK